MAVKSFPFCAGVTRVGLWPFLAPCEGAEHLPSGAGIVACNHSTFLDGIALASQYAWQRHRPLHMITHAAPFSHPLFGYILRSSQCIPLDRARAADGARQAMRKALAYLARGEAVGIFPEAHLNPGPRLLRPRPGVAWLALESGAPVIPSGLVGGGRVWPAGKKLPRWVRPSRRMVWRIGPPLDFGEESRAYRQADADERVILVARVLERVMREIALLCDRKCGKEYGGEEDDSTDSGASSEPD